MATVRRCVVQLFFRCPANHCGHKIFGAVALKTNRQISVWVGLYWQRRTELCRRYDGRTIQIRSMEMNQNPRTRGSIVPLIKPVEVSEAANARARTRLCLKKKLGEFLFIQAYIANARTCNLLFALYDHCPRQRI